MPKNWKQLLADPGHPVWSIARLVLLAAFVVAGTALTSNNYTFALDDELGHDVGTTGVIWLIAERFLKRKAD